MNISRKQAKLFLVGFILSLYGIYIAFSLRHNIARWDQIVFAPILVAYIGIMIYLAVSINRRKG
jgi:hypothetical protein